MFFAMAAQSMPYRLCFSAIMPILSYDSDDIGLGSTHQQSEEAEFVQVQLSGQDLNWANTPTRSFVRSSA